MLMNNYTNSDYLQHFGVKGMKWGVRRFQKKNGTLTAAGKKRYSDNIESNDKHRMALEEEYRKSGMSHKKARILADKRIKAEKIILAAAGVTVAACAAYVIHKKLKDRVDQVINVNETLQRIEMQDTEGKLHSMFYASKGKHDSKRYYGMLGATRQQQMGQAFLMKMNPVNKIKIASKENAKKKFKELYENDSEFRANVLPYIYTHFNGSNHAFNGDKIDYRKAYENFNANIMRIRNSGSGADEKFFNTLKKAGYGGVQDINDMKFSGYNAKNPLIIFDRDNVVVKSFDRINKNLAETGTREFMKANSEIKIRQITEKYGAATAAGLGATYAALQAEDAVLKKRYDSHKGNKNR